MDSNRAFHYLVRNAPLLASFREDPDVQRMHDRLSTASGGEGVMIRAALSFSGDLGKESFQLWELERLDRANANLIAKAILLS